jgi:hypothetical protein
VFDIRPTAAVHLREALEAASNGQGAKAIAALMHIDGPSWVAIEDRLSVLGTDLATVLASATASNGAVDAR